MTLHKYINRLDEWKTRGTAMILECFYHAIGDDMTNLLNKKHSHDNCYV